MCLKHSGHLTFGNKHAIPKCARKQRHAAAVLEWSDPAGLCWLTYCSDTCKQTLCDLKHRRQFQDFHLFCTTIIRASGSWFTLRTAARTARWKRLRSDGADWEKGWWESSVVLETGRCVLPLPALHPLLPHGHNVCRLCVCEIQLLLRCSILTPLPLLSSKLLDSPQKRGG